MRRFRLHEPASVQEASQLLGQYGDAARIKGGGTELLILMKMGLLHCEHLINLKSVPGLDTIRYDEATGRLHIGALATHRDVEQSPLVLEHFPVLSQMEHDVANVRVRNVGTIAGNLCFADPYSDPGTLLACLQAEVVLQRGAQQRTIPIDTFSVDAYTTSREDDELLVEIRIPPLPPRSAAAYQTFRFYERPSANVAVMVSLGEDGENIKEFRVAVGVVPPVPTRLKAVEVAAQNANAKTVAEAADEASGSAVQDLDVFGDTHGSPAYLRNLVRVLLRRATGSALATARG